MKVLQPGKPWAKEFDCTGSGNNNVGCGAKLLVSQGDLYQTAHHSYDGSSDYYTTFCCPCCGAETDVKVNEKIYGVRPSNEYRMNLKKQYSLHSQS